MRWRTQLRSLSSRTKRNSLVSILRQESSLALDSESKPIWFLAGTRISKLKAQPISTIRAPGTLKWNLAWILDVHKLHSCSMSPKVKLDPISMKSTLKTRVLWETSHRRRTCRESLVSTSNSPRLTTHRWRHWTNRAIVSSLPYTRLATNRRCLLSACQLKKSSLLSGTRKSPTLTSIERQIYFRNM